MGIKELISRFPLVGQILNEYQIGCVTCEVGTCLLKDIVGIHNLREEEEKALFARIAGVIYPDRKAVTSASPPMEVGTQSANISAGKPEELKYSPPMKRLVDEHTLIKKLLALIPSLLANMDIESEADRKMLFDGIDFIRSYADKYHHAKEEEILFGYFDAGLDIIKVMHQDHHKGRGYVQSAAEAIERRDKKGVTEYLNAYRNLLAEHIKKEDEILYPWMDRNLSTAQIGELFQKFDAAEREFGNTRIKYEKLIEKLINFSRSAGLTATNSH